MTTYTVHGGTHLWESVQPCVEDGASLMLQLAILGAEDDVAARL